jgi:hypothetical protein
MDGHGLADFVCGFGYQPLPLLLFYLATRAVHKYYQVAAHIFLRFLVSAAQTLLRTA